MPDNPFRKVLEELDAAEAEQRQRTSVTDTVPSTDATRAWLDNLLKETAERQETHEAGQAERERRRNERRAEFLRSALGNNGSMPHMLSPEEKTAYESELATLGGSEMPTPSAIERRAAPQLAGPPTGGPQSLPAPPAQMPASAAPAGDVGQQDGDIPWHLRMGRMIEGGIDEGDRVLASLLGFDSPEALNRRAGNALNAAGQGLTFGGMDEGEAGLQATFRYLFDNPDDQSWNELYTPYLEQRRGEAAQYTEENPGEAMGLEIAGALPSMLATGGLSAAKASVPLMKNAVGKHVTDMGRDPALLHRLAKGIAGGAATGAGYGFAAGEGGAENRLAESLIPGAAGAALGPVGVGAGMGARAIAQKMATSRAARAGDVPKRTVANMQDMLEADFPPSQGPVTAQPGANIADIGPRARGRMRTAVEQVGNLARPATEAINRRADRATDDLAGALDDALVPPVGMEAAKQRIKGRGDPLDVIFGSGQGKGEGAVKKAYDRAYDTPVDYSSAQGRAIEEFMGSRLRGENMLRNVLGKAKQLMDTEGVQSKQFKVTMPTRRGGQPRISRIDDVRQLDYIKRALDSLAEQNMKPDGSFTQIGRNYAGMAKQLRDLTAEAVPEYGDALLLARNDLSARSAMEFGQKALDPSMTVDQFTTSIARMSPLERKFVEQGWRDRMDETIARITPPYRSDPSIAGHMARGRQADPEAVKTIELLTRGDTMRKLTALVGEEKAGKLAAKVDEAADRIRTRDALAENPVKEAEVMRRRQQQIRNLGIGAQFRQHGLPGGVGAIANTLRGNTPEAQVYKALDTDEALINTLLRDADPKKLTALRDSPKPAPAGRRARRLAEILAQRVPMAAIPAMPDMQGLQGY